MVGVLIVSGIIFYAVLYSGVSELGGSSIPGAPVSVLNALTGKGQSAAKTTTTEGDTGPVTPIGANASTSGAGGKRLG